MSKHINIPFDKTNTCQIRCPMSISKNSNFIRILNKSLKMLT